MDSEISKLRYILYVKRTDINSIRAMRLVPKNARIAVQDVDELGSRPGFLTGVPTLVRMEDDEILSGTNALTELRRYVKFLDSHFYLPDISSNNNNSKIAIVQPQPITANQAPVLSTTNQTQPITANTQAQMTMPPPNLDLTGNMVQLQSPSQLPIPPANIALPSKVDPNVILPMPSAPSAAADFKEMVAPPNFDPFADVRPAATVTPPIPPQQGPQVQTVPLQPIQMQQVQAQAAPPNVQVQQGQPQKRPGRKTKTASVTREADPPVLPNIRIAPPPPLPESSNN